MEFFGENKVWKRYGLNREAILISKLLSGMYISFYRNCILHEAEYLLVFKFVYPRHNIAMIWLIFWFGIKTEWIANSTTITPFSRYYTKEIATNQYKSIQANKIALLSCSFTYCYCVMHDEWFLCNTANYRIKTFIAHLYFEWIKTKYQTLNSDKKNQGKHAMPHYSPVIARSTACYQSS